MTNIKISAFRYFQFSRFQPQFDKQRNCAKSFKVKVRFYKSKTKPRFSERNGSFVIILLSKQ